MGSLMDRLAETSWVKNLLAEDAEQQQQTRAQLVTRIRDSQAREEREMPGLHKQAAEARRAYEGALPAFNALANKLNAAAAAVSNASNEFTAERTRIEGELRATAPLRELDAFGAEMDQLDERTRRMSVTSWGADEDTGRKAGSNIKAIRARLDAIRAARRRVEEMKVEVIEDLQGEFAKLRASIPVVTDD